jgi:hypothetical protein
MLPEKLKTRQETDHGKVRKVGSSNVNCTELSQVEGTCSEKYSKLYDTELTE